jgi:alkylation response protein AidB-like acyl-CoA dehydrogenase
MLADEKIPAFLTRDIRVTMATVAPALDSETQGMIEASLNRFINDDCDPAARLKRLHSVPVDYRASWEALAELGLCAVPVSEARGGMGGNTQDMAAALRVLSRGLLLEPLVECAVIANALLVARSDASPLDELLSGQSLTVPVGGRRGDALSCRLEDGRYILSGSARVVPGAGTADQWLIACNNTAVNNSHAGAAIILRAMRVDIDARIESYKMMDGRGASDIEFRDALLPKDSLWLEGSVAASALHAASAQAVCAYCADAVGVMACLVKQTGDYLKTREQFGVVLSTFQALQHRYADMHWPHSSLALLPASWRAASIALTQNRLSGFATRHPPSSRAAAP